MNFSLKYVTLPKLASLNVVSCGQLQSRVVELHFNQIYNLIENPWRKRRKYERIRKLNKHLIDGLNLKRPSRHGPCKREAGMRKRSSPWRILHQEVREKERKSVCPIGFSLLQRQWKSEKNGEGWKQGRSQWTNLAACRVLVRLNEYCPRYPGALYLFLLIPLCLSKKASPLTLFTKVFPNTFSSRWHSLSLNRNKFCSTFPNIWNWNRLVKN